MIALFVPILAPVGALLPEPDRPWTFLVYGAADNNADGPILRFLDELRAALDDDPGMELVLFLDRHAKFSNDASVLGSDFTGGRIYRLRKGSAERVDPGEDFPELAGDGDPEVDSADPATLGRFLAFGKKRFPAKRYGLLIYSHADGRGMCPDAESGHEMWIPELPATVGADRSVDFLGLELCGMCGVEIAYEWRPGNGGFSADVLLAIPNAGPPLDWARAFARIRSPGHASEASGTPLDPASMTASDLGRLVVEEGERGRRQVAEQGEEDVRYEAAACLDLSAAAAVKSRIDALAVALAETGARKHFEDVRGPSLAGKTIDYSGGRVDGAPYFDAYQLCARAAASVELPDGVRRAARAAAEAVDRMVLASFGMDALEMDGFEPGKSGVYLVFPAGDEPVRDPSGNEGTLWSRFRWYSPLPRAGGEGPYGSWRFLGDGATPGNGVVETWYELLDSWYDPDPDGTGGVNGYRW